MPWLAFNMIPDALQSVLSGLLKGMGKQKLAACASVAINLCLNMPLSYVVGIKLGYGCPGMFCSLAFGNYILVLFYAAIAFMGNWKDLADSINKKMTEDSFSIELRSDPPRLSGRKL